MTGLIFQNFCRCSTFLLSHGRLTLCSTNKLGSLTACTFKCFILRACFHFRCWSRSSNYIFFVHHILTSTIRLILIAGRLIGYVYWTDTDEQCVCQFQLGINMFICWCMCAMLNRSQSVMEFESKTVAQQMTLLDAELFQKIEVSAL